MSDSWNLMALLPVEASVRAEAPPFRGAVAVMANPVMANEETFSEYFQRLSDELLWPRILVRTPPPDEDQAESA